MRSRHILVFALGVFIGCLLLATTSQGAWLCTAAAAGVLLAALLVLLLLAVLFAQTAVACVGILTALAAGLSHYSTFLGSDARMAAGVLFTAYLYLPLFSAFLAGAPECPPISPTGAIRLMLTVSFLPVCLLAYAILSLADPPNGIETVMLHGISSWLPIPLPGFLACCAAVGYLTLRSHDHAERNHWFAAALTLGAVSLAFRSSLWPDAVQAAMLVWTAGGVMLILTGAALDAGWRHANVDELTQLPSRRPLLNHMQRLQPPFVLAVVDIDRFKSVNDSFGHAVGDQVLRFIASRLRQVQTANAASYRYGGEEFVVVLPGYDAAGALPVLEDLRQRIEGQPFVLRDAARPPGRPIADIDARQSTADRSIVITVSIGFAVADDRHETPSDVLIAADRALYQAKSEGRNRVVQAGQA